MRFMVILPANEQSEAAVMPSDEIVAAMGRFNEEMAKAGVLLAADGLYPTSRGARIRFSGDTTTVTDGPFTESKDMIGGYWILQVKSRDEAISWMRRAPFGGGVELTLREIIDPADFAEDLSPEARAAADERLRAHVAVKA
jgi:hypothetical protein